MQNRSTLNRMPLNLIRRSTTITADLPAADIRHDSAAHRFTLEVDGARAVLDYTLTGDRMVITHTGVPARIGGRGIAAQLMRAALQAARTHGWAVDPLCSYAAAYMAKHPEQVG